MQTTWMPSTETGVIHNRAEVPDSVFAFPRQRKEPLTDADHVRNALARFDQVEGVSDADRDLAFANIKAAAAYYGVDVRENSWRDEDCFRDRNAMFLRHRLAEARDCYLLKHKGDVEREVLFKGPLGHDPLP